MKRFLLFLAATAACVASADADLVSNVSARQVSPWPLLEISYDLAEDIQPSQAGYSLLTDVIVTDQEHGTNYTATTFREPPTYTQGRHTLLWDMAADGAEFQSCDVVATVSIEERSLAYCVVDLSAGASASSYPVSYLYAEPSGGVNKDEYKTTKLILKRLSHGSFKMQGSTTTTLTQDFYMGVFEVTQKQWELVMGSNPSNFKGDTLPVEKVSYNAIRGSSNGAQWPSSSAVDSSSFLGKLQAKTGLAFDLPTEAQWEYACRARTTTIYYWGNSMNGNYAWYTSNSSSKTHPVGGKTPNAWGLYDMSGNVWEWCLDWYGTLSYGTDPKGSSSGSSRVMRGGSWLGNESYCESSYRSRSNPLNTLSYDDLGFRLSRTLP